MNKEIFKLEQLLLQDEEQAIPYLFSYREECRPTPFGEVDEDCIDWSQIPLDITIAPVEGDEVGGTRISVRPMDQQDEDSLLNLLDSTDPENGYLYFVDLTAEAAYEIILDRFFKYRSAWWPEVYGPTS